MNEQVWWYLARSSGIVALTLLVLGLVWGVLLVTKVLPADGGPRWLLEMHRWFGSLAVIMTGLHLLGLVLDGYVELGWVDVLVPGASRYEPQGVALGILGMYGLIAVQVSSAIRRHLSRAVWHRIHLIAYAVTWASAMHAGMVGTDVGSTAYRALALVLTLGAVSAVLVRLLMPTRSRRRRAPLAGSVAADRAASSR